MGAESKKVSALRATVWSKNKRGPGPPGHSHGSASGLDGGTECVMLTIIIICSKGTYLKKYTFLPRAYGNFFILNYTTPRSNSHERLLINHSTHGQIGTFKWAQSHHLREPELRNPGTFSF